MLSTAYRLRLEEICNKIAKHENVELNEIIWAEKLAAHNTTAARFLRQARRISSTPDMKPGGLDDF
jgi:1,4-dihydroxy-2-naphthoyl-CoA synthase